MSEKEMKHSEETLEYYHKYQKKCIVNTNPYGWNGATYNVDFC
jgi:hypothetical protein